MYKKIIDPITNNVSANAILRMADNAFVPFDPANTDYQAYLKWLDAGNTPEAADEVVNG